jgi:hypothetical protein
VTAPKAATAAENKPVYDFRLAWVRGMDEDKVRHTKMRMPSASFCQRSAIVLSSSSDIFRYILKRGVELSVYPECSPSFGTSRGPPGGYVGTIREDDAEG